MGFFDAIGDIINPANLATAGGFLVGGPPGAAIGRGAAKTAFGDDWKPGGPDAGIGGGIQGGMEGAAIGYGGSALGGALGGGGSGVAGGALESGGMGGLPGMGAAGGLSGGPAAAGGALPGMGAAAGLSGETAGLAGGAGGALGGAGGAAAGGAAGGGGGGGPFTSALEGLNSYEKLMLGSQALGTAGQIYSGIEQGQLQDERRERQRRFTNELAPYVGEMMEGVY